MRRADRRIERRLSRIVAELAEARERAVIAREQYNAVLDDDEDAATRAVVSERVSDRREAAAAHRQVEVMQNAIERAVAVVAALEHERDELLARYQPGGS